MRGRVRTANLPPRPVSVPIRAAIALALLAGCAERPAPEAAVPVRPASLEPAGGVAVVELFTSEGCSSCPPADAVLRDLAARADETGEAIYALSFHVDYWDRLGWADPYSDPAHTARQRATAAAGGFDAGRVFTPAMIVGGAGGFVGSNRRTAEVRVAEALATPPPATVRLSARGEGGAVSVRYAVEGAPEGARLHLALVQDEAAQDVTRGENRGRRLSHARVVRAFATVAAGRGTATLGAPADLDLDGSRVVAYVQPGEVGSVLGAAEAQL